MADKKVAESKIENGGDQISTLEQKLVKLYPNDYPNSSCMSYHSNSKFEDMDVLIATLKNGRQVQFVVSNPQQEVIYAILT